MITPAVTVHSDPRLSTATVAFGHKGRRNVTIVAKLTARLMENAPAMLLPPAPLVLADEYASDATLSSLKAPSEIAPRLLAADVLFRGTAFQPPGSEGQSRVVGVGLHRGGQPLIHKLLYVYGDRVEGVPRPFRRMPISWERAFGGPGHELNPVGSGLAAGSAPNVVDPRNGRHPAGFGPLSRRWPVRAKLVGAHPLERFEGSLLDLPEDLPLSFFQCAPHDQRIRFLAGDEWVVLDGLHPIAARFQARLPGMRVVARMFTRGSSPDGQHARLNLDMLLIDGDTLVVSLVFRHVFETQAIPSDLAFTVGCVGEDGIEELPPAPAWPEREGGAPLGDTLTMGPMTQRSVSTRPATPYGDAAPRAGIVAELPGAPWTGPSAAVPPAEAQKETLKLRLSDAPRQETLLSADHPHAPLGEGRPTAPPEPALVTRGLPFEPSNVVVTEVHDREELADAAPASLPPPVAPASMRCPPASAPLPSDDPSSLLPSSGPGEETGIRRAVLERLKQGEPLSTLDLAGADLSGLSLAKAMLRGANLSGTKLAGACLDGAKLSGANLSSADLRAASLLAADLSGADLSRSSMDAADFTGATLDDANLKLATLIGTTLRDCKARRATLVQCRAEGAVFERADLTLVEAGDADFGGASFVLATLIEAKLGNVRADQSSFEGAKLGQASLVGASLRETNFEEADLAYADLAGADLSSAKLTRAVLRNAQLGKAALPSVSAHGAVLDAAALAGVTAEDADFEGASFIGGDLRQGRFPRASFAQAKLMRVTAQKLIAPGARFEQADFTGASLRFAKLRGADLRQATLASCDLRDAELDGSDLRGANRETCKLSGATLKDAKEGELS